MIIDSKDNVAVAIEPIAKGETATYVCEGKEVSLPALEDITIYHKLATRDIRKGEPVVKYGEHIGVHCRSAERYRCANLPSRLSAGR